MRLPCSTAVGAMVGRSWGWMATELGALVTLLGRALRALPRMERAAAVHQAHRLVDFNGLFFIAVIMSFMGSILVVQACTQGRRLIGDLSPVGPGFLQLLVREFGPTTVALMVAARYGASVASELGAMQVTEQVDALRMTGADPAAYLVAPRVFAGLAVLLPLAIFGTTVAFVVGGVAGYYGFDVGWDSYFRMTLVSGSDVAVGVAKALAFGVAVPLVSCHTGLSAYGGSTGVGRATTNAVIGSSVLVLVLDFFIGAVGYAVLP